MSVSTHTQALGVYNDHMYTYVRTYYYFTTMYYSIMYASYILPYHVATYTRTDVCTYINTYCMVGNFCRVQIFVDFACSAYP